MGMYAHTAFLEMKDEIVVFIRHASRIGCATVVVSLDAQVEWANTMLILTSVVQNAFDDMGMYAHPPHGLGVKIALGVVLPFTLIILLCVGLCYYVFRKNQGVCYMYRNVMGTGARKILLHVSGFRKVY